jgi:L-ascorbate metabolism protein UlaG (beta-lactamase superfamily)
MKIKWLGHSSFLITSDKGVRIITDPYTTDQRLTYGQIDETADIVTVSHEHGDHNNAAAVKGKPAIVKESADVKGLKIKGVPVAHDEEGGAKRGKDVMFCFTLDGINFCHTGDLGHLLTPKQIADVGKVDVLMIPVGGFFTIDANVATQVCEQLKPKAVIPMHFKNDKCNFPITGVEEFTKGKKNVTMMTTSEVEFKAGKLPASTQIMVLKPAK